MDLATIQAAIESAGMTPRGAFRPVPDDGVPDLADGRAAATVVMVGNARPAMWERFSAERDPFRDLLDDWSRDRLTALAAELGGAALFPFQRPHLPFQRWARRAEACRRSPLGIFIHPDHGLWHGYRGALAFAQRLDLPPPDTRPSPCDSCPDKPCLTACPVAAFDGESYDVPACARHIASPAGQDCMDLGCRARRACPVGRDARYVPDQAAFHMRAFLKARRADGLA